MATSVSKGGKVKKDPISGNTIPPNGTAKGVRDDVPALLSEGEYVIPEYVVNTYGSKAFDDLLKQTEDMLKTRPAKVQKSGQPPVQVMAEGGSVQGYFNPDDWRTVGGSYFNSTTTVTYSNGSTTILIRFVNGQPIDPIPAGYYPVDPNAATPAQTTTTTTTERESDGPNYGETDPNTLSESYYSYSEEQFREMLKEPSFFDKAMDTLLGGGLLGEVMSQAKVDDLKAAAVIASELGYTEVATDLLAESAKLAGEIDPSLAGGLIDSLGSGAAGVIQKHRDLGVEVVPEVMANLTQSSRLVDLSKPEEIKLAPPGTASSAPVVVPSGGVGSSAGVSTSTYIPTAPAPVTPTDTYVAPPGTFVGTPPAVTTPKVQTTTLPPPSNTTPIPSAPVTYAPPPAPLPEGVNYYPGAGSAGRAVISGLTGGDSRSQVPTITPTPTVQDVQPSSAVIEPGMNSTAFVETSVAPSPTRDVRPAVVTPTQPTPMAPPQPYVSGVTPIPTLAGYNPNVVTPNPSAVVPPAAIPAQSADIQKYLDQTSAVDSGNQRIVVPSAETMPTLPSVEILMDGPVRPTQPGLDLLPLESSLEPPKAPELSPESIRFSNKDATTGAPQTFGVQSLSYGIPDTGAGTNLPVGATAGESSYQPRQGVAPASTTQTDPNSNVAKDATQSGAGQTTGNMVVGGFSDGSVMVRDPNGSITRYANGDVAVIDGVSVQVRDGVAYANGQPVEVGKSITPVSDDLTKATPTSATSFASQTQYTPKEANKHNAAFISGVPVDLVTEARQAAASAGLPPELEPVFLGLISQESMFKPNTVSTAGAVGLTQVMPNTAKDPGYGVTPIEDITKASNAQNLKFGAEYLAAMYEKYNGDLELALMAYNQGPGATDSGTKTAEATNYAAQVLTAADNWSSYLSGEGEGSSTSGASYISDSQREGYYDSVGDTGYSTPVGDLTYGTQYGTSDPFAGTSGLGGLSFGTSIEGTPPQEDYDSPGPMAKGGLVKKRRVVQKKVDRYAKGGLVLRRNKK